MQLKAQGSFSSNLPIFLNCNFFLKVRNLALIILNIHTLFTYRLLEFLMFFFMFMFKTKSCRLPKTYPSEKHISWVQHFCTVLAVFFLTVCSKKILFLKLFKSVLFFSTQFNLCYPFVLQLGLFVILCIPFWGSPTWWLG